MYKFGNGLLCESCIYTSLCQKINKQTITFKHLKLRINFPKTSTLLFHINLLRINTLRINPLRMLPLSLHHILEI